MANFKIEYRTPAGTGSYATLASDDDWNGLAEQISGWQPQVAYSPQVEPGAFASSTFVSGVGNALWQFSFTVERLHASPEDAAAFLTEHALLFQVPARQNFDLKVTVNDGAVVYCANCALARFAPDPHSDMSTRCSYSFTGGSYSRTAP